MIEYNNVDYAALDSNSWFFALNRLEEVGDMELMIEFNKYSYPGKRGSETVYVPRDLGIEVLEASKKPTKIVVELLEAMSEYGGFENARC
jgi:hypothetical protein